MTAQVVTSRWGFKTRPVRVVGATIALMCVAAICPTPASAQVTYDPAADFSAINNPNGVWTYGWTQSLGSTFNLGTSFQLSLGLSSWVGPVQGAFGDFFPTLSHNDTGATINVENLSYPPGRFAMHPGPGGEYAVLRFTALQAATINVTGAYSKFDPFGSTDVHIIHNGASVLDGLLGAANTVPFSFQRSVTPGDILDFAVGPNGVYFNDTTGLSLSITPVPEPGGLALCGLALVTATGRAWRKRNAIRADVGQAR